MNTKSNGDLDNFIAAFTPGGIEAQEAAEQKKMVENCQLPKRVSGAMWGQLEEIWGIKVTGIVDDLFYKVALPEGWKLQATNHSMWSDLLDKDGCKRASIFYKGAFYDRRADMRVNPRYAMNYVYSKDEPTKLTIRVVDAKEGCKTLFTSETVLSSSYKETDRIAKEASDWLSKNHPEFNNPLAYWK